MNRSNVLLLSGLGLIVLLTSRAEGHGIPEERAVFAGALQGTMLNPRRTARGGREEIRAKTTVSPAALAISRASSTVRAEPALFSSSPRMPASL